eukprot:jgi/Mesen1/5149/ME000255S04119
MYIEEISIDGFKSYAKRTIVSHFDPYFNAITGLNGSGKSNILDSICFVLGITNLANVRAASLQELVYKQGQAGITKATVSIVFNNSDKKTSPVGFEDHPQLTITRQIVLGGRNKYLIDGRMAQPSQVQNLFHSVGLNVNNPHFLIMQGRITKVLNMKPPETLTMLEEAAGTRMYETKKEGALKTLEKKQIKVDEIDRVLAENILPALEKLRKERADYQQWTQGNSDIEKLQRYCIAYDFFQAEKRKDAAVGELDKLKEAVAELEGQEEALCLEAEQKEAAMKDLSAKKEKEMGTAMESLALAVDALSKDLVKDTTAWSNEDNNLQAEKSAAEQLRKSEEESDSVVAEKAALLAKAEEGLAALSAKVAELATALSNAELEYEGVQAGRSGQLGEDKSFAEKINDAKAAAVEAQTQAKQAKLTIQHLEKELVKKRKLLQGKQKEANGLQAELAAMKAEMDKCTLALAAQNYDEAHGAELESIKKEKGDSTKRLKSKVGELAANLNVGFTYDNPEKGFNRSKVKGVVARLFSMRDVSAATALEVVAGGRLHNVVVDTEHTGKLLLEKGGLKRRVTLIPLNKIDARKIPSQVQAAAARLVGAENVRPALSLVEYDSDVEAAMAYVFGGHFVCKDSATAQKVAFHPDILTPCVTLEGDVFSPSGLLTGGSRSKGGVLLTKLKELAEGEAQLRADEALLKDVLAELAGLAEVGAKHKKLSAELQLKGHQLALLEERIQQSEHHQLGEEVAAMEAEVGAARELAASAEARQSQCGSEVAALEQEAAEQGKAREARLKQLELKMKSAKQAHAAASKELKAMESERERLAMDRDECIKEKGGLHDQIAAADAQVAKLAEKVELLAQKISNCKHGSQQRSRSSQDFGAVFSTLLPGTTAKLEPPEGGDFTDGLEVKVAFGGVWKQSLSELSGGQRSLLALSLILALLLYKPAPLYILDEVDAALDLSHTQNIGRMIKQHFPHSQFLVVSLKEGMFNNANIIFRTKFVDGVSTVTRTVPAGRPQNEREPTRGRQFLGTPSSRRATEPENVTPIRA